MSFIAFKMATHQTNKGKPRASKCRHFCFSFDIHNYCPTCRESGKGDDPCVSFETPCDIYASDEQMNKIQHRKRYVKKQKTDASSTKDDELDLLGERDRDSFTGSNADLECAVDNLFTSAPTSPTPTQPVHCLVKTPAKTVPPTPGTALQQKIETNLEKSLGSSLNIHLQQQIGSFQASMLEAFQYLRDELTSKKQVEVDQTSTYKPGTSQGAVNLDLPSPRQPRANSNVEQMEVDYSPALPPHLHADYHLASDQPSGPTEEPSKKASVRPKNTHSHSRHNVESRSASDQYNDESDEHRIASSKSKKHADKSKHKVRSRYVSSSSEEDQSSVA